MRKLTKIVSVLAIGSSMFMSASLGYSADKTTSSEAIMGAGSSFIYPALSRWANSYYKDYNVKVNYQPIGSGGGQRQIFAGTVDFAASDQALTNAQLQQHHLKQFPAIIGGIVMAINIPGVQSNQLILNGHLVADIYLGKITNWNDPRIQKLNPNLKLPNLPIITVHRADGSGTTFNFTKYLSDISSEWKQSVGANTSVNWKVGLGSKGNQGVAAEVQQIKGAIGYVEYAYAKQTNMPVAEMLNKAGKIVQPSLATFASAAKNANYKPQNNFNLILTNQPGANSWPIVATTFVLLPENISQQKSDEIKNFFKYSYGPKGQAIAKSLDYVSIPANVVSQVENYWN